MTGRDPMGEGVGNAQYIQAVKDIFSTITPTYDFLNRLLSGRRDVAWRKSMVAEMDFYQTYRYLDVAAGSCDVMIRCLNVHPEVRAVGVDFVSEMIHRGKERLRRASAGNRSEVYLGDATDLPFLDHTFDVSGIAFGIRNIPQKARALSEMARVVVPGGQVIVLELTMPENPILSAIYTLYLTQLLPRLAGLFTDSWRAYEYLGDSITSFTTNRDFLNLMAYAGIEQPLAIPLSLGVCHLFAGRTRVV